MTSQNFQSGRDKYRRLKSVPALWLIGLLVLIALLVLSESYWVHRELQRAADDARKRVRVYQTSLTTTVERHRYLPDVLASDPRIVDALSEPPQDSDTSLSALFERLNSQAESNEIFLMDSTGLTRWSSNYRSSTSFVGQNYGFRPYFKQAMSGQPGFYFAVGATSGIPGLFMSSPVVDSLDSIVGVIVVKISLAPLEMRWRESGDWVWVTDEQGIVFLASSPEWHYIATEPLQQSHRTQLAETLQYGQSPVPELDPAPDWSGDNWSAVKLPDGGVHILFDDALEDYGWTTNLVVPLDDLRRQVRFTQSIILLLLLTLSGGLLYALERFRRRKVQNALVKMSADREQHQHAIIENTDVGLFNLDKSFNLLYFNQKASDLFGLDNDTGGFSPQSLIHPWRSDTTEAYRAVGQRGDGEQFPVLVTLNAIQLDNRREYILTIKDITELTQAQQALETANQELEARVEKRTRDLEAAQAALAQSQRLASLGRMSSAIAHEINQPITALSNYIASSRLLLNRNRFESVKENMDRIDGLVGRLSRLSRQLRIFAGKRNTGSSSVSLLQPVQYALDLLAPRIKSQQVHCNLTATSSVTVQANSMFLEQILVNLLSNALDALIDRPNPEITILLEFPQGQDHSVALSISDNGPGMTDEQLAQIFEPFFTTKKVGDGMGLGLAISYNLASDMNAQLAAFSEPGQGATFVLTFDQANWEEEEPK